MTDLFLTDVIAYYARMGTQPVCLQVHSVKVGGTAGTAPGLSVPCKGWHSSGWGLPAAPNPDPPAQPSLQSHFSISAQQREPWNSPQGHRFPALLGSGCSPTVSDAGSKQGFVRSSLYLAEALQGFLQHHLICFLPALL